RYELIGWLLSQRLPDPEDEIHIFLYETVLCFAECIEYQIMMCHSIFHEFAQMLTRIDNDSQVFTVDDTADTRYILPGLSDQKKACALERVHGLIRHFVIRQCFFLSVEQIVHFDIRHGRLPYRNIDMDGSCVWAGKKPGTLEHLGLYQVLE